MVDAINKRNNWSVPVQITTCHVRAKNIEAPRAVTLRRSRLTAQGGKMAESAMQLLFRKRMAVTGRQASVQG